MHCVVNWEVGLLHVIDNLEGSLVRLLTDQLRGLPPIVLCVLVSSKILCVESILSGTLYHVPREMSTILYYLIRNGCSAVEEVHGRRQQSIVGTCMKGLEMPRLH